MAFLLRGFRKSGDPGGIAGAAGSRQNLSAGSANAGMSGYTQRRRGPGRLRPFFVSAIWFSCPRTPDSTTTELVINQQLDDLLTPLVADLGLELWGIEFNPGAGNSLLRVYIEAIDRPVSVEDCEAVSRELSALLDVNDPIPGHYTLEVSSPGIDRLLFTPAQFARHVGDSVKLTLNIAVEGRKRYQGPITSVVDDRITIQQDGVEVGVAHANIHVARIAPDYVALGLAAAPKRPPPKKAAPKV